tara:strand:- start:4082 stop:4402 length:321 start_codon:yes stop_codon:yes gene_type:complete
MLEENTKFQKHTVNKLGLEMIRQELLSKCKSSAFSGWREDDLIESKRSQEMLKWWASDIKALIEEDLDSSNAYFVQIDSHLTKSGRFEHISIDDSGIDVSSKEVAG